MIDTQELEQKLQKEFEKIRENSKKANIFIAGATGVGKSSFLNLIFGKDLAQSGTGKSVTSEIQKYEDPDIPVVIYDSIGAELGAETDFYAQAKELILEKKGTEDKAIHVVWYCIGASSHRIQDFDKKNIKLFRGLGVQIAVIFTKSDLISEDDEEKLTATLQSMDLNVPSFFVSVKDSKISKNKELIGWTEEILPDQVRESFISGQREDLEKKWQRAHKCIITYSGAALGIGVSPIPFSDAPLLVALQTTMVAHIFRIYNLGSLGNSLKGSALSGIVGRLVSQLAKSLIGNLLKLIPVIGSVIGGAINGGVATAITFAIGEGTNSTCYKLYEQVLSGNFEAAKDILDNFGESVAEFAEKSISEGKKKSEDYRLEK